MNRIMLGAAWAVLLMASFSFALSAEDVARFYLKSGESMVVVPVAVSGQTDDLVKINGAPSLVLAPSGSSYKPITDSAQLQLVLNTYLEAAYSQNNFQKSAMLLNQTTPEVQRVLTDCQIGAATFLKIIITRKVNVGDNVVGLYFLINRSSTYTNEQHAINELNGSFALFNDSLNVYLPQAEQFDARVASGNHEDVLSAVQTLQSSAVKVLSSYVNMTDAYQIMNASHDLNGILTFSFYENGNAHTCQLNTNVTTALSQVVNAFSDRSLEPETNLQQTILAFTQERGLAAGKDTDYAVRNDEASSVASSVSNLISQYNYSGYSFALTALVHQQSLLQTALDSVKSTGQTASFDSGFTALTALASQYQSALGSFKSAALALKSSAQNVSAAQKKYGEADTRVAELNSEQSVLNANMTAAVNWLSSGDVAKASSHFTALASEASDLSNRAGSLPPQGNQLDVSVIGGVIVLVFVLIGTVWYFRKMKKSQPKTGS